MHFIKAIPNMCNGSKVKSNPYMFLKTVPDKYGLIRVKFYLAMIIQAVPKFGCSKVQSDLFVIIQAVHEFGYSKVKSSLFVIFKAAPDKCPLSGSCSTSV